MNFLDPDSRMPNPLSILYRDEHIVAINKPAGLLVHRSRIDVHAREFALQMLRDQMGQSVFPVHRIDRPTSGVLLFALSKDVARDLSKQFENRTVQKSYLAIVRGHPPATGQWDEPLVEKHDRIVDQLADSNKEAQPATTRFEARKYWTIPYSAGKYPNSRYSLIQAQPLTGRKHQLRRHFNHMAYPIVGDTTYGDRRHNRVFRERLLVRRLLLVAHCLTFIHPKSGVEQTIQADVGLEFHEAIDRLNDLTIES